MWAMQNEGIQYDAAKMINAKDEDLKRATEEMEKLKLSTNAYSIHAEVLKTRDSKSLICLCRSKQDSLISMIWKKL